MLRHEALAEVGGEFLEQVGQRAAPPAVEQYGSGTMRCGTAAEMQDMVEAEAEVRGGGSSSGRPKATRWRGDRGDRLWQQPGAKGEGEGTCATAAVAPVAHLPLLLGW